MWFLPLWRRRAFAADAIAWSAPCPEHLRGTSARQVLAGRVVQLGGAEDDALRAMDDLALGAQRARPRRAQKLHVQGRSEERLAVVEQRPARAAHGRVEQRRDEASVDDRA